MESFLFIKTKDLQNHKIGVSVFEMKILQLFLVNPYCKLKKKEKRE